MTGSKGNSEFSFYNTLRVEGKQISLFLVVSQLKIEQYTDISLQFFCKTLKPQLHIKQVPMLENW